MSEPKPTKPGTAFFATHIPRISAPRWLENRYVLAFVLLVLVVPFFVPIPIALKRHTLISSLGDQLHTVFLAGLTFLFYWRGPFTGRLWLSVIAAVIAGAAIEFIQLSVGRMALMHDFLLDLVGIGIVAGFILWRGHASRWGLTVMLLLLLSIPVQLYELPIRVIVANETKNKFPIIADFEGRFDYALLTERYEAAAEIYPQSDLSDTNSVNMVLVLQGQPPHQWPGVTIGRFPYDWSTKQYLEMDVRNLTTGKDFVKFGVRLDDFLGIFDDQWIQQPFYATNEWQTIRYPINNQQVLFGDRLFSTTDVYQILIYFPVPAFDTTIEIDNLRLR